MHKKATIKTYKLLMILVAFFFCAAIGKLSYVVLSENVDGVNLKDKSASITTATKTLYAYRGSIFDVNGENLATTVNSYKLIAYLSPSRTTNEKKPQHVVDKEETAKKLAPILGISEEDILKRLEKDVYQTEFGTKGNNLSEKVKREIQALELPGLDFITSNKRYYDMATFASYIVGYAKASDDGEITGELGIESYYDDLLAGENGSTTYQKYTSSNYQIPNTPSTTIPARNGSDIYLTIDGSIQLIAEKAVSEYKKQEVEWAVFTVMDAKTGAIVASATYPNFDPNDTNTITTYMNPTISNQYEPGSVMKIFTWATAIEEGSYNGEETYKSGSLEVDDSTIRDSNRTGWGTISYDTGFAYSSNTGAARLALEKIGIKKEREYLEKLGFGHKTGIELSNEFLGSVNINNKVELATASFGQGVSVTPIQMLQALSTMTNDGNMIRPYIVSKIVDADGNITYEGKRTVVNNVYSTKTVEKMHELMHKMVYDGNQGTRWQVPNVNIMGKTGTAQIASPKGGYLTGDYDYIKSFAGIFPADNPKYIVYAAAKRVHSLSNVFHKPIVTGIEEIASYAKLTENQNDTTTIKTIDVSSYISKEVSNVTSLLESKNINLIVIGDGKYIINQYPLKNNTIFVGGKLFLVTNGGNITMPDMTGWSMNEVKTYCDLAKLKCSFNKSGYATSQSIAPGEVVDANTEIAFDFESKMAAN